MTISGHLSNRSAAAGVVVQLAGGLGNQMFQYAAGRALADRLGVELGLDLRHFRAADSRPFGLGSHRIRAVAIPDEELAGVGARPRWRWWIRRGWREAWHRPKYATLHAIVHLGEDYLDVLEHAGPGTWLCGWWHSERYFAAIADRLRADLSLQRISDVSAELERRIRGLDYAVGVHVRRGDYAAVASTRAHHGLCSVEYYQAAMARVRAERPDATFVFFSDDPEWVAASLGVADERLITANGPDRPEEDLHLLSCCRAHIIANSTFSWWGAWLAGSERVIAPTHWFQTPGFDVPDVVPARWLRM